MDTVGAIDPETRGRTMVHVLIVTHRHGEGYWVHRTEEGAMTSLAAWARTFWDEEFDERDPVDGLTNDQIIEKYFDLNGRECWTIEELELGHRLPCGDTPVSCGQPAIVG